MCTQKHRKHLRMEAQSVQPQGTDREDRPAVIFLWSGVRAGLAPCSHLFCHAGNNSQSVTEFGLAHAGWGQLIRRALSAFLGVEGPFEINLFFTWGATGLPLSPWRFSVARCVSLQLSYNMSRNITYVFMFVLKHTVYDASFVCFIIAQL